MPRTQTKPNRELKVISDFYDFMLYLIQRIEKFPRHHRYSLGMTIETRLQAILSKLLEAKYAREKRDLLAHVNIELETLRFQLRLARDLRALPVKSHGFAARQMESIGGQVGGWLRQKQATA